MKTLVHDIIGCGPENLAMAMRKYKPAGGQRPKFEWRGDTLLPVLTVNSTQVIASLYTGTHLRHSH